MACPTIKYGIPTGGATQYNVNSGRELFRCGIGCVKMYITNVSLDKSTVYYVCGDITDANVEANGKTACLQSMNITWRERNVVNWIAKDNVDTTLDDGFVITMVGDCNDLQGVIYTHTEGTMNVRAFVNVEDFDTNLANALKNAVLNKVSQIATQTADANIVSQLTWILSDLSNDVSPTDWQRGSVSYQGFGVIPNSDGTRSYRINFNWNNGRGEEASTTTVYDRDPTPQFLENIITNLIALAP